MKKISLKNRSIIFLTTIFISGTSLANNSSTGLTGVTSPRFCEATALASYDRCIDKCGGMFLPPELQECESKCVYDLFSSIGMCRGKAPYHDYICSEIDKSLDALKSFYDKNCRENVGLVNPDCLAAMDDIIRLQNASISRCSEEIPLPVPAPEPAPLPKDGDLFQIND